MEEGDVWEGGEVRGEGVGMVGLGVMSEWGLEWGFLWGV